MMEQRRSILILGAVFLALVCPSSELPKNHVRHHDTGSAIATDEIPEISPYEEDDYYQEFLGIPMASSTDDFGVKGRPGIDFPNLAAIPVTSFTCRNVKESGYFADMETKCQVFHICDGGRKMSFLCPNGTIFRQSHLICDWWFRVDCDDSQDFYEPSADTLRRDRERIKHDRMPSESRESMSITTEFELPTKVIPKTREVGRRYHETTQPLHPSNQRATTVQPSIKPDEERNVRTDQQRKFNRQHYQYVQQEESHVQESPSHQRDSEHRTRVKSRSRSDEYNSRDNAQVKLADDEGNARSSKETENKEKPSLYFKEEEPIKKVPQTYNRDSENLNSDINSRNSASDEFILANRRIDSVERKNPDCIHDENEGQILAETASFASSHRRGRLESVTFSQITDDIPIFEIPSKEEETDKPSTNEDIDSVVTYKPPIDEIDPVVTYRPVMDLEKYLHQRREKLTKNDDEDDEEHEKRYTGARIPPNIPLSSGPGAVHSLALYIATGGDNLVYNTPRRIDGSLKGIVPTDSILVEQPRASTFSQKSTPPVPQKTSSKLPQFSATTEIYKSVSPLKESGPPYALKEQSVRNGITTQSPVIITAPSKSYLEHTTKSPIFNLEESDPSQKASETNLPPNPPLTKDIPYVLVTSSLSGRGRKIVNSRRKPNTVQYLPTAEFSASYGSEKTATEITPLKNTEPPSLNVNLVTTFLPKETNIPLTEISFKSLKKDSDVVNIRSPIISTLTKKEHFQDTNKVNKTIITSENKGRSSIDGTLYSAGPIEYSNTQRPATTNEAEGISFFEKEQYFRLDKAQPTKDYGGYLNKPFTSKAEVNHKKSDVSAKKMKDYLLGNFTSEDSGLFQHINKALSETNATSLDEDTMNILYKNAIESTLKEAMSIGSVTEPVLDASSTTEEHLSELQTEIPSTTEDAPGSTETIEEMTKVPPSDIIQITPFFKLENGKITSTPSKFPEDDDLSTTPSDLRELAQVFSRALSAYLEDPETFREALASVSHPPNPTLPSGILSDPSLSNSTVLDEEDDEVLDFSDVQVPTTTTVDPRKTETTSSKPHTGFYITIPFTTPAYKTQKKNSNFNKQNDLSQQDAEGPDSKNSQPTTTSIPELITILPVQNESMILSAQLRSENSSSTVQTSLLDTEEWLKEQEVPKIETTTINIPEPKPITERNVPLNVDSSFGIQSSDKPITENLPPLEIDLLPPFQDPIPEQEKLGVDEENNGFTEINIPTAALDEILNEFVPEELNRLAMTSIEPDVIPDSKSNYLSSYVGSLDPNSLSAYDFQKINPSTTPQTTTTSTTSIPSTTVTTLNDGETILTRLTARLPQANNQGKSSTVTSQGNTVPYSTYANQLLKAVTNPVTEKDESLIRAQSANFLPSPPSSNSLRKQSADKVIEQSTSELDESNSSPTEESFVEKTTQVLVENQDYEFINRSTGRIRSEFPDVEPQTVSTTEAEIIAEMKEERSYPGNPRLVLLFVNDHNAKGRGINEKNARLLKALLRKDDHHILRSAGLIPDDSDTREATTSTTDYNPYTIASITPKSQSVRKTTTTNPQPGSGQDHVELRTEPPITTYAPKFTMTWLPFKKARSPPRNETSKVEKLQATEPTKPRAEETTPINIETSTSSTRLAEKLTTDLDSTTSILGGEDKSTVSDGRAFDLLRSLYSLTARWG